MILHLHLHLLGGQKLVPLGKLNIPIKLLRDRMDQWRGEGYNVSELEDLFK